MSLDEHATPGATLLRHTPEPPQKYPPTQSVSTAQLVLQALPAHPVYGPQLAVGGDGTVHAPFSHVLAWVTDAGVNPGLPG
jgi:hypothetical protein